MDMQMPEMDGLCATRAIRALGGERGNVAIIGLTANAMSVDRDACFGAGMNDYLPKPVERKSLLERVERWGHERRHLSAPAPLRAAAPRPTLELDPSLVRDLVESMGREETKDLLCSFRAGLAKVAADLAGLGPVELRSRAHQLAGSAGALGFERVSSAARVVDQTLVAGGEVVGPLARLQAAVDETLRELDDTTIERWLAA
jgi:CheY-like chemotaxis protein